MVLGVTFGTVRSVEVGFRSGLEAFVSAPDKRALEWSEHGEQSFIRLNSWHQDVHCERTRL